MTPAPPAAAPPQYAEEPALYVFQIALTANQTARSQKVPIDPDSDFMLTGLNGTSTGLYSINLLLPSGRMLANLQLRSDNLVGTANQPTAIGPSPIYPAAGVGPVLDLTDLSAAPNNIEIVFSGIRRFKISH
jgi:hypothetical protein